MSPYDLSRGRITYRAKKTSSGEIIEEAIA